MVKAEDGGLEKLKRATGKRTAKKMEGSGNGAVARGHYKGANGKGDGTRRTALRGRKVLQSAVPRRAIRTGGRYSGHNRRFDLGRWGGENCHTGGGERAQVRKRRATSRS